MKVTTLKQIHIGSIIKEIAASKAISARNISQALGHTGSNTYNIFRRSTIDSEKLCILSVLLETNFFQYYLDLDPLNSLFGQRFRDLEKKISELNSIVKEKNEIITDKRNIISMLEDKLHNCNQIIDSNAKKPKPLNSGSRK